MLMAKPVTPPAGYKSFGNAGLVIPSDINAAQFGLYNTPRSTGTLDWYRPRWFATGDIRKLVTEYDRWELMNFSRQLFAGLGNVSAAIQQRAQRVVGEYFHAQYHGEDKAWGDQAEEWLEHVFYPNCDLRGQPYDFVQDLILTAIALDVDGDDAMILTEDEDTHFPKLQFIPAHRINTRMQAGSSNNARVNGGRFDGALISQGIIYDSNMMVVGLRVLGDGETEDRDIPMTGCQLLYDPVWQSQNRGIPPLSCEVMSALDYQDIDVFLKRIVKRASEIGLLRFTEEGQADTGMGFIDDAPVGDWTPGIKREVIRGGEDYWLRANKGETIQTIDAKMPSESIEAYIKRLEHRIILALGWHAELLNPKEIGGASVRLIQDNARAQVRHKQKLIVMRAKRAVRYAIAKAMKHGFLPRNNVDWWKWDFEMPAVITVDAGHDAAGDRMMLALGAMTEEKYHAKYGDAGRQVRKQKSREVLERIQEAEAIAKETGKPFDWVYEQLWNPASTQQSNGPEGDRQANGGGGGGGVGGNPDNSQ